MEVGQPLLIDFADAVRLDARGSWEGEVHWGRWEFVPPEQFEGRTRLDASVDTYAAAGLVVLLATGRGPFQGNLAARDRADWGALRRSFQAARARPALDGLPEDVREVVARALAPAPADRFRTAADLRSALEAV